MEKVGKEDEDLENEVGRAEMDGSQIGANPSAFFSYIETKLR